MSYDTEAQPRTLLLLTRKLLKDHPATPARRLGDFFSVLTIKHRRAAGPAFLLVVVLACLRFAHLHLLWADEDYHLAAAINLLHGKVPYRDFWYDKPPLTAFYYLLIGGHFGWPLRLLDAGYVMVGCGLAYKLARNWWGQTEGVIAALLLASSLAFYLPSAVIAFAADAVMLVPHLAAIYCAQRRRALASGVLCGIAFLANAKAVFVLATCALWLLPVPALALLCGFALPVCLSGGAAILWGAWPGYVEQVWHWGFLYTAGTPVANPLRTGLLRTLDWAGFHAAVVAGAFCGMAKTGRSERWKLLAWIALSFAGVALGSRFAPHYFLQLLPPLVILGSRGIVLACHRYRRKAAVGFMVLALIPAVRFGPRYVSLTLDELAGRDPRWNDVALDLDSRQVAAEIGKMAQGGDTLMVWGYRPDIYVYTRLVSDSRFWDSQPLTGVPADRHLTSISSIYREAAKANRWELARSHPTFLVDGLGLMNPRLSPERYPELRAWLANYEPIARTRLSRIYKRKK